MTRRIARPHAARSIAMSVATALLGAALLLAGAGTASADVPPTGAVIDQTNASPYSCTAAAGGLWQTFTAGATGTLTSITVDPINDVNQTTPPGTVSFYAVDPTTHMPTGSVLQTADYPAGPSPVISNLTGGGIAVVAGLQYAFSVPAGSTFGCSIDDAYPAGGQYDFVGGAYTPSNFPYVDFGFTTYVEPNPTVAAVSVSTSEETPVDVALDVSGAFTSVSAGAAAHGTVTSPTPTTLTYTPAPGYFGLDSFDYSVTNGPGVSNVATVTIMVTEPTVTLSKSTVAIGSDVTVTGAGFPANVSATVALHSTPVTLATVTTSATGTFSVDVTVPGGVDLGAHTIVVSGAIPVPVTVDLTVTAVAKLASTGVTTEWLVPVAGALLLLGAAGTWSGAYSRRRRRAG